MTSKKEAERKGAALAARLGKGWQARVWENSGWHYAALFDEDGGPSLQVYPVKPTDEYRAYLSDNDGPGQPSHYCEGWKSCPTPEEAVDAAFTAAREFEGVVSRTRALAGRAAAARGGDNG